MTIEELRAYVKQQQDSALGSYIGGMMSWREGSFINASKERVIDLTTKILNMIDYGQETRPAEPKAEEVKKPIVKEPLTEEELKKIRERNERITRAFKSFYDRDISRIIAYDED